MQGGTAPYSFTWNPGGMTGSSVIVSPGTTTAYTVTVTDANNCTATAQESEIHVYALPNVTFTANPKSGCAPLCVSFNNTTPNSIAVQWLFGDGQGTSGPEALYCYPLAGNYNITLNATDSNGCSNLLTIPDLIKVFPNPVADFTMTPPNAAPVSSPVLFNDGSTGSSHWLWNFGDLLNNTSSLKNPTFIYSGLGSYTINLIVTSNEGCTDTISKEIIIIPEFTIYIPNAFTPDGDGINDFFGPQGVEFYDFEMEIYNRWGEALPNSSPQLRGEEEGLWDGTINGKDSAPEGVYVYKIRVKDFKGENHYYVGNVTLIR